MQEERTHTKATKEKNKFCEKQCFCFFFPGELSPFFDKEIREKKSDSVFCSVNSTNIANIIVKFRQNFDTKFFLKKHW